MKHCCSKACNCRQICAFGSDTRPLSPDKAYRHFDLLVSGLWKIECACTHQQDMILWVSRLLADPQKNDIAQSVRTSAVRQQVVIFSRHENKSHPIHITSKLWSSELPILIVVNEDARLAVLGLFSGDTPISWILDCLGSGSITSYLVSQRKSQACCRFA